MTNEELLRKTCIAYENELKKLLSPEEFAELSHRIAKTLFSEEIMGMADGDFKEFCLNSFEAVTGSDEDFTTLMNDLNTDKFYIDDDGDLGDEDY